MNAYIRKFCLAILLGAGFMLAVSGMAADKKKATKKAAANAAEITTDDYNYSWKGYPETAQKSQAKLLVERRTPKTVRPNKEYSYEIKVTNRSYFKIDEVILTEVIPAGFEMIKVSPKPETRDRILKWNFGMLAPGQKEVITITGKATRPGSVVHEGDAQANFNLGEMTTIMEVVRPALDCALEYKEKAIVTEIIPVTFTFKNIGSALVEDAQLVHTLQPGLTTDKGNSKFQIPIGDLQPDQEKKFKLLLKASKIGIYQNDFVATAKNNVKATAKMRNVIQKPKLVLSANAPKKRFVGNHIRYELDLKNTGDGEAKNGVATLTLPAQTRLVSANEGGEVKNGMVVWELATLQPNETKELQANVVADAIMTARVTASAEAFAASKVSQNLTTEVAGIPALLLVLTDVNDPVAVGETETYTITVTNQGSLAATGVVVKCDLEASMGLVKSDGPTKGTLNGSVLTFQPLAKLEPKGKAVWKVVIKAKKPGDVRFTASIECDQLTRPARENEATHFYE